jgi:hypothetical protein
MREIEEMEDYIKKNWFTNHEANFTRLDGVTVLDWKEKGTSIYSVRYIFAGSRLYVSGDIGDAIFNLTWHSTPESFNDVNLGYLLGKLSCHSRDRWHFDEKKARNDLREWYEEAIYDAERKFLEETKEVHKNLKQIINSVSTPKELERELFDFYMDNSFYYYDAEDFSMFTDFGKKLPMVFVAYLLGIKLANEQCKSKVTQ